MAKPRRIGIDERRARLAVLHHLAPAARVTDVVDAARGIVCLHGTDPVSVYLSAWARLKRPERAAIERALYDDRGLLRMLAMRRTVWVVPVDDAPVLQAAATVEVARRERRRNEQLVEMLGVKQPKPWLRAAEKAALEALAARGEAGATDLAKDVPALARQVRLAVGKTYEGSVGMASRVLFVLAAEGHVVRTRPRGTWISSQFRWTTTERWLGKPLATVAVDEARDGMARRWLARFGPGTADDLAWWAGWPLGVTRATLARIEAVEVELDGGATGYLLADDRPPAAPRAPWVALLPALDPTTMGWKARDFYLGPHKAALFDRSGNAGPTIWVDGRIAGGWAARAGGVVVTRLLEDVGRAATAAVAAEAERLTGWLDGTALAARFPTPLSRELLAG